MRRPMIALAVLIVATFGALALLVKPVPARQVAEKPVISDQRATVSRAHCLATGPAERRVTWIVRGKDGSLKTFGFVLVRKCSR